MATKKKVPAKKAAVKAPTTKTMSYNVKQLKALEKKYADKLKADPILKQLMQTVADGGIPNGSDVCKIYNEYGDVFDFVVRMLKVSKFLQRIFKVLFATLKANCEALPAPIPES